MFTTLTFCLFVIRCCKFSNTGEFLISGSKDCSLIKWDVASGQELMRYNGHLSFVYGCDLSKDDRYVVAASTDATLQ